MEYVYAYREIFIIMQCAFKMCNLCRRQVEKRTLFEKLDAAFLILDEIVDGGYVIIV